MTGRSEKILTALQSGPVDKPWLVEEVCATLDRLYPEDRPHKLGKIARGLTWLVLRDKVRVSELPKERGDGSTVPAKYSLRETDTSDEHST